MAQVLLVRYGEIHLKGLNRPFFERMLMRRIREAGAAVCPFELRGDQGRFFITDFDPAHTQALLQAVCGVFGVHSAGAAVACDAHLPQIESQALAFVRAQYPQGGAFKVEARRGDKHFPMTSPQLAAHLGALVLQHLPGTRVDLHNPQWKLCVEVRDRAYIYSHFEPGPGGMPVGCAGRAMLLLSGGIVSPVAGYMIARRGDELQEIYFDSPPNTSARARRKVERLAAILARSCGAIRLHVVRFTDVQEALLKNCREEYLTLLMRRCMMRIAERLAEHNDCLALVTGEDLGQVASQTAQSIAVTDAAVAYIPVLRPLIAFDKTEIIDRARAIGTFETSIEPYEDCCTLFVPRHPNTKPKLVWVLNEERKLDIDALCAAALAQTEQILITPDTHSPEERP